MSSSSYMLHLKSHEVVSCTCSNYTVVATSLKLGVDTQPTAVPRILSLIYSMLTASATMWNAFGHGAGFAFRLSSSCEAPSRRLGPPWRRSGGPPSRDTRYRVDRAPPSPARRRTHNGIAEQSGDVASQNSERLKSRSYRIS